MKKITLSILFLLLLTACDSGANQQTFDGSDFSFHYPEAYDLRKAATMFVFEDADGNAAITMHRYLAKEPGEVIDQMKSVGQLCAFENGGTRFGGYKAYAIVMETEGKCDLEGSLVTNRKGIMMLFIENDPSASELKRILKKSFKFN